MLDRAEPPRSSSRESHAERGRKAAALGPVSFLGVLGVDGRMWTEPSDDARDISRLLRSFEIREAVGGSPTSLPKGMAEQVGSLLRAQVGTRRQSRASAGKYT